MHIAEDEVLDMVGAGILSIDIGGRIWRHKVRHVRRIGVWNDIATRRAEHPSGHGYLTFNLKINGRQRKAMAHRVVWRYFNGDIPTGLEIHHKNYVKDDNRPENLACVSRSENMSLAAREGKVHPPRGGLGEANHNATLNQWEVQAIRCLMKSGKYLATDIARFMGISISHTTDIARGSSWKHLPSIEI